MKRNDSVKNIEKKLGEGNNRLVGRSVILNGLDYVVQIIAMFLVTPAIARGLGVSLYGEWLLLMAVLGYLPLLEAGVSAAGTKYLASALTLKDPQIFGRRLGAVRRMLGISGWIAFAVMLMGIGISVWIISTGNASPDSAWVFAVFIPPTLLTFWLRDRLLVLRAYLRYELIVATTLFRTILQAFLVLVTLGNTSSLVWLAIAHAVPQSLCFLLQHVLACRLISKDSIDVLPPSPEDIKSLRSISNHVFTSQIAMSVSGRTEPFLVSALDGVGAVPLHGIARRFTGILTDAFQTIFGSVLTVTFSLSTGADKERESYRELARYCRLIAFLAGFVGALLFCVGGPFIGTWLPREFGAAWPLLAILIPSLSLRLASSPISWFLLAQGEHKLMSRFSIVLSIMSVGFMLIFGLNHGVTGIFEGLASAEILLFGGILPLSMSTRVGQSVLRFYSINIFAPVVAGALGPFGVGWLAPQLLVPSYGQLVVFSLIAGILTIPGTLFCVRTK